MELLSFLYPILELVFIGLLVYFAVVRWYLLFIFLAALFLYPWVLEPLLLVWFWLVGKVRNSKARHARLHDYLRGRNRLVYNPIYNLRVMGLEKKHSFDAYKYEKIINFLTQRQPNGNFQNYAHSQDPDYPFLYTHIGLQHLIMLNYSLYLSKIVEVMVAFVPSVLLRIFAIRRFLHNTQGSLTAACQAVDKGWAINLGGGYHHAHKYGGGGFCPFNDIGLVIEHLWENHPQIKRILIIDLDAHQGNGHARDKIRLMEEIDQANSRHGTASPNLIDRKVFVADMYNQHIYPHDTFAEKGIDLAVKLSSLENDRTFLPKLERLLQSITDSFTPDFIIYNAGTDILEGDHLGRMNITPVGILKRDELVFDYARQNNVPLLMVLSGGYQKSNAEIIANSIINLTLKFGDSATASE
jgi:histone deacetylase 11